MINNEQALQYKKDEQVLRLQYPQQKMNPLLMPELVIEGDDNNNMRRCKHSSQNIWIPLLQVDYQKG